MAVSKRDLPVLVGHHYDHVVGKASIEETPTGITIVIEAKGQEGQDLKTFLTEGMEPVALSFMGIPVTPRSQHPIKE